MNFTLFRLGVGRLRLIPESIGVPTNPLSSLPLRAFRKGLVTRLGLEPRTY